ncbi:COQ9 family protein [bacterium]|nr:COQ9 family protein [bacterium]
MHGNMQMLNIRDTSRKDRKMKELAEEKARFLDALCAEVPFSGWSRESMKRAGEASGVDEFTQYRLFPGGESEALEAFQEMLDEAMVAAIHADKEWAKRKIRDKIAQAVLYRLGAISAYKEVIRRAVAYYSLPTHWAEATKRLYKTVDAMWYEAGDTATDYNFYTKRLLLAGVYSSTLMVWLEDQSEDAEETREFLMRRIDNVMSINKLKAKLPGFMQMGRNK